MNKVIFVIVACASAAIGLMFFQKISQLPKPEHALYYQETRVVKPFELTDELGKSFTKAQLKDKWSIVFFGYTNCPDVCPTTLQKLGFIYDDLKAIANNTQILLITVDPQRDSQEKLSQYIAFFNPEFKALRAGHEVLFPFSRNVGLMYAITSDEENAEGYLVDHSASLVLINPEGRIAAIFKPEQIIGEVPVIDSDKLLSDYQKIVALY